ncbi:GxxExxY protein [Anaerolineales bacterium HSG25]|nr:GxxExxY protein [Anaerolineales bacterium HSG25]
MPQIIHKTLSYAVRGILFDVHNNLGPLLPETIYQEAVSYGLRQQRIKHETEKQFYIIYREDVVGKFYVDHWIEDGKLLLELKVTPQIEPVHQAQAISYLKLTDADLAIVVNFGERSLNDQRLPNYIRNKTTNVAWHPQPHADDRLYPVLLDTLWEVLHRVHFELGPGYIHRVYRRATMIELAYQDLSYQYVKHIPLYYHDHFVGTQKTKLIAIDDKLLLAVFALKRIEPVKVAQMKARLRHLNMPLGLLANFYGERLEIVVVRVK